MFRPVLFVACSFCSSSLLHNVQNVIALIRCGTPEPHVTLALKRPTITRFFHQEWVGGFGTASASYCWLEGDRGEKEDEKRKNGDNQSIIVDMMVEAERR